MIYKTSKGYLLLFIVLSLTLSSVGLYSLFINLDLWITIMFLSFATIFILGVVHAVSYKMILEENKIEIKELFRKTVIQREDTISISNEKGAPIYIITDTDKHEVKVNIHPNTLRAWIRKNKDLPK
jgi:hypothetical protein